MKDKHMISVLILTILFVVGCKKREYESTVEYHRQFEKLTITEITPKGWIRGFLERQRDGLTGHIEVAGYPFNTCLWACEKMKGSTKAWWPYEQTAYYLDGVHRLGILLEDEELVGKARKNTEYVLTHVEGNGRFGTNLADRWWRWPYASFNRILMTQYEVTGEVRILDALTDHYRTFEAEDFCDDLELANVEQLCWLYEQTDDTTFLTMAEEAYKLFKSDINYRNRSGQHGPSDISFASNRVPDHHGVVYMELAKVPVLLYKYTGKEAYLGEAENALAKMERYHALPGGLPSTTEHFEPTSETAGYEICNTAVFPYTYGHLLRINGDASLGDKIEKAVFNAGIGAITKDFKAHQYFSAPNQAIADASSNPFGHHPARMAFLPGHDVECCTGNVNRFMPYFVEQMWLSTPDHGLVANLYGPSSVKTEVGPEGQMVEIEAVTNYPFSDTIEFLFGANEAVEFPFLLRIPGWCASPQIILNGKLLAESVESGSYHRVDQIFNDGDVLTLVLPMEVEQKEWATNGLSIERGPLTFSLPVGYQRTRFGLENKGTEDFPGWKLKPTTDWNYTLADSNFVVVQKDVSGYPWEENGSPIAIRANLRKVYNWQLSTFFDDHFKVETRRTPAFPENLDLSEAIEELELVPYGNTLLRISVFPNPYLN